MEEKFAKCISCGVVIDEVGESVALFCNCLIILCSNCAKKEVLEKKGFRKECVTCPACKQTTPLDNILLNQNQIVSAEWDLFQEACSHFSKPRPSFGRKSEKQLKEILNCYPMDEFYISKEIQESKSIDQLMTYIAYLERQREVRDLQAVEVKKNPEDCIKFCSNPFLERVLHLVHETGKNEFRVTPVCIACYSDIPQNQSVLLLCDCVDADHCLTCTYQHLANQPNTYHEGLHCPNCSRASAVIDNIEAAERLETQLVETACTHFKVRKDTKDYLLQLCGAYRSLNIKSSFDVTSTSKEYNEAFLRLEVARLETARQQKSHESKKWLGPMAKLTFRKHKFLEIFLTEGTKQVLYHDQPAKSYTPQTVEDVGHKMMLTNKLFAGKLRGAYSPFATVSKPKKATAIGSLEQLASLMDLEGESEPLLSDSGYATKEVDEGGSFSRMQISGSGSESSLQQKLASASVHKLQDKTAKGNEQQQHQKADKEEEVPNLSYSSYFNTRPAAPEPLPDLTPTGAKIAEAYSTAANQIRFNAMGRRDAYDTPVNTAVPTQYSHLGLPPGFRPPPPSTPPQPHLLRKDYNEPRKDSQAVLSSNDRTSYHRQHHDSAKYKHATQLWDSEQHHETAKEARGRGEGAGYRKVSDREPDWKFSVSEKADKNKEDEVDQWKDRHAGRYFQEDHRDRGDGLRESLPKRRQLPREQFSHPDSLNRHDHHQHKGNKDRDIIYHRDYESPEEPIRAFEDRTGHHSKELLEPRAPPGVERKSFQYQPPPPPPPTPSQPPPIPRVPVFSTGFEYKYVTNYDLPKYNPVVDASTVSNIAEDLVAYKNNSIRALCQALAFSDLDEFTLYVSCGFKSQATVPLVTTYNFDFRIYFDPYYDIHTKYPEHNKYACVDEDQKVYYETKLEAYSAKTTLTMLPALITKQVGLDTTQLHSYKRLNNGYLLKHKSTLGELNVSTTGTLVLKIMRKAVHGAEEDDDT